MKTGCRWQVAGGRLEQRTRSQLPVTPGPDTHSSGFTLLEVMVVLGLMSLMMGLAAVYLGGTMGTSRVEKSAREISGTVMYGRALAGEKGEIQSVALDLDSRSYRIEGRTTKVIPADLAIWIIDGLGVETSSGRHFMHLLPSGAVQGGTVVLQKGRSIVRIEPDPIVGVRVVRQ